MKKTGQRQGSPSGKQLKKPVVLSLYNRRPGPVQRGPGLALALYGTIGIILPVFQPQDRKESPP